MSTKVIQKLHYSRNKTKSKTTHKRQEIIRIGSKNSPIKIYPVKEKARGKKRRPKKSANNLMNKIKRKI